MYGGIVGAGNSDGFYLNIQIIKQGGLGKDGRSMSDFQEAIKSGKIKFCCPCTIEIYGCRISNQFIEALGGLTGCDVIATGGSCGKAGSPQWESGAETWIEKTKKST